MMISAALMLLLVDQMRVDVARARMVLVVALLVAVVTI